jgi:chemotaxis protein MotB
MAFEQFSVPDPERAGSPFATVRKRDGAQIGHTEVYRSAGRDRPTALISAQWSADEPNWLMTLSDLTLLLLCFFVLWYVNDTQQRAARTAANTQATSSAPPATVPSSASTTVPVPEDWGTVNAEMKKLLEESGLSRDILLEPAPRDFVISISDAVSFASGRADLRAKALPVLDKLAALILNRPALLVEVSGHTDNRRISSPKFPSNWELSTARASRVARYLIQKGIDPSRIAVQGYASERPKLPHSDLEASRANRRVEVRLYQAAHAEAAAQN